MSTTAMEAERRARPLERQRGRWGMYMFIATEAMLFALLFFSYFYLGAQSREWPPKEDPAIRLALVMTVLLLSSSVAVWWGEHGIEKGSQIRLNIGLGLGILLGSIFIGVQVWEYHNHLKLLTPRSGAYGSIFYTITSFHGAHVIGGILMLSYVLLLSLRGWINEQHHSWVRNVSLYWHFVDLVWLFILSILYLSPRLYQ